MKEESTTVLPLITSHRLGIQNMSFLLYFADLNTFCDTTSFMGHTGQLDENKVISVIRLRTYAHVATKSSTEEVGRVFCMEEEGILSRGTHKKTC